MCIISLFNIWTLGDSSSAFFTLTTMPWQPIQLPCKTNHTLGLRYNHRRYICWMEDLVTGIALEVHHLVFASPTLPCYHLRFPIQTPSLGFNSFTRSQLHFLPLNIHSKIITPVPICCNASRWELDRISWVPPTTVRGFGLGVMGFFWGICGLFGYIITTFESTAVWEGGVYLVMWCGLDTYVCSVVRAPDWNSS